MEHKPSYEELIAKLAEFQEIIRALRNQEVDAVVGAQNILMLRLRETEDKLREQRDYLDKLVKELEAANKELESFSYSVSHDLMAPLRAIAGYSRMILKRQGEHFDEETQRQFDMIRNNAVVMGELIDGLLQFSRLGKKEISRVTLNMEEMINEIWQGQLVSNPDRNMTLRVEGMQPGQGDPSLIREVLNNLLDNAVKFTRNRGLTVIEMGSMVTDKETVYYIRDNGVGFDMKYHDKLFGVFRRLHSANEYEGTGIGLALVNRVINRHGGRVWAEGEVDKGATFYFTLPAIKNKAHV